MNNIAPTELNTFTIQSFYYYVAPTELKKPNLVPFYYDIAPTELYFDLEKQIDQLVYKLYNLTEDENKIVEGK